MNVPSWFAVTATGTSLSGGRRSVSVPSWQKPVAPVTSTSLLGGVGVGSILVISTGGLITTVTVAGAQAALAVRLMTGLQ